MMHSLRNFKFVWLSLALTSFGFAQDPAANLEPGHSTHGEAFNEGPRQKAYLMQNTGNVHFPVTINAATGKQEAQSFFNQGVGQLHGFWYFEAERSFREVARIDPDCAMAYWGLAMANTNNRTRARGLIVEAVKRKDKASDRERMYISALEAFLKAEDNRKKQRAETYTKALEAILLKYPDDLEAKAFLALQIWLNRDSELPVTSYLAVDALLDQIFAANPLHPVHHYRIHLWDYEKPEKALASAAMCGQSAPGIAHMWHMPGHIYSRVKRYDDACWQQEASARVDHAHMMRDRVLPDQIHNFAHNNEWLIRDLIFVGRVHDAVSLAKNMIELPRHPKYNTLEKGGSYKFGRMRLFQTLSTYEMWDELIALCSTPYLEPTENQDEQVKRLRHLGVAYIRKGDLDQGRAQLAQLNDRLQKEKDARDKAGKDAESKAKDNAIDKTKLAELVAEAEKKAKEENKDDAGVQQAKTEAEQKYRDEQHKAKEKDITKASEDARKPFDTKIRSLEKATKELDGHLAVAAKEFKKGHELLKEAGDANAGYLALVQLQSGDQEAALKAIQKEVDGRKNEVQPLAMQVQVFWQAGKKDEAKKAFEALREISGSMDLDLPAFIRLAPIAKELGFPDDWRLHKALPTDVGNRPSLDKLGPFRWQPSPAPEWTLKNAAGETQSSKQLQGKPSVVIFYLGYSCLHCAEQLQKFAPLKEQFDKVGISLTAISTDDQLGLNTAIGNFEGGKFPFTLLSNSDLDVFKSYRCYDDFEQKPLHGTFLLDGQSRIRWQDISYQPFMDADFLLKEATRLFSQDTTASPLATK
jgi:peroxiredoxin